MENRNNEVLFHLVEHYIKHAEPVGSQALVKEYEFTCSSATVRNCYMDLEEEGYLLQPHTSAGRIPSEKAFHWYVEQLQDTPANQKESSLLKSTPKETKQYAKSCVKLTGIASLVGTNRSDTYYTGLSELFKQPEFHDWSRVVSMGNLLDELDERLMQIRIETFKQPTVTLGSDCPFGASCGAIMLTLPKNELLVILGPMRMDYGRAKRIMNTIYELTSV